MASQSDDWVWFLIIAIILAGLYFVFVHPFLWAYGNYGSLGVVGLLALYITVGAFLSYFVYWAWKETNRRKRVWEHKAAMQHRAEEEARMRKLSSRQYLYSLTPRDFEYAVAKILEAHGYKTGVTAYTGDYGTDIVATKSGRRYVVQVKQFSEHVKVGTRDLQILQGSMLHYKAEAMMFVTLGFFSATAIRYARANGIELIDGNELIEMARAVPFPKSTLPDWENLEVGGGEQKQWLPPWQ